MADQTYKATTRVTISQIEGGWFSSKVDGEQAALIRAFNKLPMALQAALRGDANRGDGFITGAQVMSQGGDPYAANDFDNPLEAA